MKRSLLALWFIVGATATILAQPTQPKQITALDLTNLADGTYYMTKTGTDISLVPMILVQPSQTNPPAPQSNLSEISEQEARKTGDISTAQDLVVAYSVVLLREDDGAYGSIAEMEAASVAAVNSVLNTEEKRTTWAPWREAVGAELDQLTRRGELSTLSQYTSAIEDIRSGLLAYTQDNVGQALNFTDLLELVGTILEAIGDDGLSITTIIEIVLEVLELFTGAGFSIQK